MSNEENQTATAAATDTTTAAAVAAQGVELEVPIQRGSQTITHVQLRRPKAGELRGLSMAALLNLDVGSVVTLLPRITQPTLIKHEVEDLDPVDFVNLSKGVVDFLVSSKELDAARAKQAEALDSLNV